MISRRLPKFVNFGSLSDRLLVSKKLSASSFIPASYSDLFHPDFLHAVFLQVKSMVLILYERYGSIFSIFF